MNLKFFACLACSAAFLLGAGSPTAEEVDIERLTQEACEGPETQIPLDALGMTALHFAVQCGREADVHELLGSENADLGTRDFLGRTALHFAAFHGRAAIAQLLIDNGADLDARDLQGKTPLQVAEAFGNEAVAQLLRDSGSELGTLEPTLNMPEAFGNKAVGELLTPWRSQQQGGPNLYAPGADFYGGRGTSGIPVDWHTPRPCVGFDCPTIDPAPVIDPQTVVPPFGGIYPPHPEYCLIYPKHPLCIGPWPDPCPYPGHPDCPQPPICESWDWRCICEQNPFSPLCPQCLSCPPPGSGPDCPIIDPDRVIDPPIWPWPWENDKVRVSPPVEFNRDFQNYRRNLDLPNYWNFDFRR